MLYLGSVFTLCSQKWQILWHNLTFYSLFLLGGRVSRIWTNFHYYVFHYLVGRGGPKGNSAKFTKSSVFFLKASLKVFNCFWHLRWWCRYVIISYQLQSKFMTWLNIDKYKYALHLNILLLWGGGGAPVGC